MCFHIDVNARKWTKRIVWKVVKAKRNRVGNLVFGSPQQQNSVPYKIGGVRKIGRNAKTTRDGGHQTHAGIYVLRTLAAAKAYAREWSLRGHGFRVVKLKVEPEDFLYASIGVGRHQNAATYRKVLVTPVVHKLPY